MRSPGISNGQEVLGLDLSSPQGARDAMLQGLGSLRGPPLLRGLWLRDRGKFPVPSLTHP